jgi:hypothetical protein
MSAKDAEAQRLRLRDQAKQDFLDKLVVDDPKLRMYWGGVSKKKPDQVRALALLLLDRCFFSHPVSAGPR